MTPPRLPLMIRTVIALHQVELGFDHRRVLSMMIDLSRHQYQNHEQSMTFYQDVLARLNGHPQIEAAALSWTFPLSERNTMAGAFDIEGRPEDDARVGDYRIVSPEYFRAVGVPVLAGRGLTDEDAHQAVFVINETMARRYWGDESPIGQRIDFGEDWRTIVGVVADARQHGLRSDPTPEAYLSFAGAHMMRRASLLVRAAGDPLTLADDVRTVVHEVDPEQAISEVRTLDQVRRDAIASPRLTAALLAVFAALALVMSVTGVSAVLAFSVSQRTNEIGIRMALGAAQANVLRTVVGQGLGLVVAGLAAGIVGALVLSRVMSGLLFGVRATDPVTFASVTALFVIAAALAATVPARRAARVDPVNALRRV